MTERAPTNREKEIKLVDIVREESNQFKGCFVSPSNLNQEEYNIVKGLMGAGLNGITLLQQIFNYKGVYGVYFNGELTHYAKCSGKLNKGFSINSEEMANRYIALYNDLINEGVYHPSTLFEVHDVSEGKKDIWFVMPSLEPFDFYEGLSQEDQIKYNYGELSCGEKDQKIILLKDITRSHKFRPTVDLGDYNWARDKDGGLYFIDLEIVSRQL